MKKKITQLLLVSASLIFSQSSHASSGTGLLFNLSVAGADVQTNTTIPNHFYPYAGAKVNTPGYELQLVNNVTNTRTGMGSNPSCTLNSDGFCLFSVSDAQSQTIRVLGQGGLVSLTLCLDANHPVSCQLYTVNVSSVGFKSLAMIQNAGNQTTSTCLLDRNGGLSQCRVAADSFASSAIKKDESQNTIENTKKNTLYVTQTSQNQISVCELNHGVVGACHANLGNGTFNAPKSVALDEARSLAYIANSGNSTISVCHLLANGDLNQCVAVSNTSLNIPSSIRLS